MKPYSAPQQHYLILAFLFIIGGALIYCSRIIFDAITGSIIFYTIFRNLFIYLTEKKKWWRGAASIAIIIGSFLIIVLPFITLIWMLYERIMFYEDHPEQLGILKEKLWPLIQKYTGNKKNTDSLLNGAQAKVFTIFSGIFNGFTNLLLQLSVMYFILYFMLKEHVKFEATIVKYLPLKKAQIDRLGLEFRNLTHSNFLGQSLICLAQGSLLTISFLIFGVDGAVFWGIVCFFLSFIPLIGAPLIFIPAGIFQILSGHTGSGIGVMVFGFVVVTNIDNVIRYYLAKRIGDIHPLITILGVVIGIPAFGILGLVYGPLLISYFILFVNIWEANNKEEISEGIKE